MTREEIKNTPELVVFMLDESITVDTRMKLHKRLEELCKLAIKALEQEPKTGHWICTIEDWNKWTCSECGFYKRTDIHVSLGYNYCPNCGVKMESEGTDADSY